LEEYSNLSEIRVTASNVGAVFALDATINVHTFVSNEHRWWSSPTFDLGPGESRVFEKAQLDPSAAGQRLRKLTDSLGTEGIAVAFQDSDGGRYRRIGTGSQHSLEFVPAEAQPPDWSPW